LEDKGDIPSSSPARAQIGKDEFEKFELEILGLMTNDLERDYVELSSEIDFLEAQIKIDTESYSPSQLQIANDKVDHYKKRAQAIKIKLEERVRN
jgi:hypothetical protein